MGKVLHALKMLNLNTSWIDKVAKDIMEKEEKIYKENVKFFQSCRFTEILLQIHDNLKGRSHISDDPYYVKFLFGDVTNEEFAKVFECIHDSRIAPNTFVEESFNEQRFTYNGLMFSIMFGQGVALRVYKIEDKLRKNL